MAFLHRSRSASALVTLIFLMTSCAPTQPKKETSDEVVGKPPPETSDSGPRSQRIGNTEIESPTGPCDGLWQRNEVRAARCTQDLWYELLINQDQRAIAVIWPRAEIVTQRNGPDGTRSERISGSEFRDQLRAVLSRPNSSALLSAMLAADAANFSFELLGDGSVRASYSDDVMKVNEYYALIEGEMRLVRAMLVSNAR